MRNTPDWMSEVTVKKDILPQDKVLYLIMQMDDYNDVKLACEKNKYFNKICKTHKQQIAKHFLDKMGLGGYHKDYYKSLKLAFQKSPPKTRELLRGDGICKK